MPLRAVVDGAAGYHWRSGYDGSGGTTGLFIIFFGQFNLIDTRPRDCTILGHWGKPVFGFHISNLNWR